MKRYLIIAFCLTGMAISASAQWEFSAQATIDLPVDEMKWVFKPGTGMILTLSKTKKYKKRGSASGVSIGYSRQVPKQDIFYYLVNDELAWIKYDKMTAYQLAYQFREDFIIKKKIELFVGGELGLYYTKYGYESHEPGHDINSSSFVGRLVAAPKAGINYQFTKSTGLFFQTKYAISIGKSDDSKDVINLHWINSVGANFRF